MKVKRHRAVTPIYRESGYARRLPRISGREKVMWLVCLVMLVLSVILIVAARGDSGFTERYYSLGFYPIWAGLLSLLTRFLPFSLAEWVILIFVIFCAASVGFLIFQMVKYRRQMGTVAARFALRAVAAASAVLLFFTLSGGLNYYRYSFAAYSGLETRPTETAQLAALCQELAEEADTLRAGLTEDAAGVSRYTAESPWALCKQAPLGYQALTAQHPEWKGLLKLSEKIPPKPVLFSQAMSYMQIVGVFCPFTMEANVNIHTTDYVIPSAMCHELAHLSGFMREDEANFISYLACRAHGDGFFRYSGVMLALVHSTNALYSQDPALCTEVMNQLSEAVRRDLAANTAYNSRYDTGFGRFSNTVNDVYLKANNQADGVESYGRMVDLLLADYRVRHGVV